MSDLFPDAIRTGRLRLERLTKETIPPLRAYDHLQEGAPHVDEITAHLPWDPYPHPKEGEEFLARVEELWEEGRSGTYAIFPREGEDGAGEWAGNCGIHVDWSARNGTFGLWLRKRFWGRGYSGERADALMTLAFDRLDLDGVSVSHLVGNENSRRAIERYVDRFGGRCDGTHRNRIPVDDEGGRDGRRYSISQADFEAAVEAGRVGKVTFDG